MKLKKFKYLLSIGATALAIAPIASLTINANSNVIVKTNVKNNEGEVVSTDPTTTSTPTITPETPTTVDATALSPAGNDLYNDYNYESGYVVKSVENHTITFYNWFKQKMWSLDVSTVLKGLSGENSKTLETMNIRGALTSTGEYDTKLFVYGNIGDTTTTTTGSYVFEVDMTTGSLVENSLVENDTGTTTTTGNSNSTLIGDVQQLTVIDANTVVVSSDISNSGTDNNHSFQVSVLTFNGNTETEEGSDTTTNGPAVTTMTAALNDYSLTFGEVLGVIKKGSEYVFAITSTNIYQTTNTSTTQNFELNVYYFYFKQNNNNLEITNFTESQVMTGNPQVSKNQAKPFHSQTIISSVPKAEITSQNNTTTTGAGNKQQVTDAQNWLENNATNFSVVYPGTAADPKMMVSFNWDTTDITPDVGANDIGKNKVTMVSFNTNTNNNGNQVIIGLYNMPTNINTSSSSSSIATLGISNLVYTRTKDGDNFIQPYAVIVGQAITSGKPSIWFNLVKLDTTATLSNTTATSGTTTTTDGNSSVTPSGGGSAQNIAVAYTAGCFGTTDLYTENGATVTSNNVKKMDWQLQFIPGNGTKTSDSIDNYYGYITTGIENSDKKVDYQENFIKLPATGTKNILADEQYLNYYQFGITDAEIKANYKAFSADTTISDLSAIDPNWFATENTKNSLVANLEQVYKYTTSENSEDTITTPWTKEDLAISNADTSKLVVNEANGTISGSITYNVKNWWNDNTTSITRDVGTLQLTDATTFNNNFSFNLSDKFALDDSNTDPKSVAKWLETKYSFDKLFPQGETSSTTASADLINFLTDLLTNANMGSSLKTILLNSLKSTQETTTPSGETGENEEGTVAENSSVKLKDQTTTTETEGTGTSTSTASAAIQVGNYITVTPSSADQSVKVDYDLSSANIPTSAFTGASATGTLNYKGFTTTPLGPNDKGYNSYQDWSGESSPADSAPGNQDGSTSANNSSSLSGGVIAAIIIAILVVIALIIGIYFFVKKRKNIQ